MIPRIAFYSCSEWLHLVPSTSISADSVMELGRGSLELPKGAEPDYERHLNFFKK